MDLFSLEYLMSLGMLIFVQAVLGVGYFLHASIAPQAIAEKPARGRRIMSAVSDLGGSIARATQKVQAALHSIATHSAVMGRKRLTQGARATVLVVALLTLSMALPQDSFADEPGAPTAAEATEATEDVAHEAGAHEAGAHEAGSSGVAASEANLFSLENLLNLFVLLFLQAVLGFDNLLYISIESQRAPEKDQEKVRRNGILIAIALRIVLLFVMISLLDNLAEPFWYFQWDGVLTGAVNFASVVFLLGGCFLMYTAVKEISHMLTIDDIGHDVQQKSKKTTTQVLFMIVFMNLIFSFDSILSALAITRVFAVLAVAIVLSGLFMLLLANSVSEFLKKNRKYEVLGMFILLIVGIVLLGETGQAAAHAMHDPSLALKVFGAEVVPMSKTTFYFSLVVLVAVDILQTGYQKKLTHERGHPKASASPDNA